MSDQLKNLPKEVRQEAETHEPQDTLTRLDEVLGYIGALLGSADPALVTVQMLNNLDSPLQQIGAALTPLAESQDFNQIPTLDGSGESLLNAAVQLAPALGVWAKSDAKKAAGALGKAATEKTRELDVQASTLSDRLGQVETQAQELSNELKSTSDQQLNELRTEFDQVKEAIASERSQTAESVENFQQQFASEQTARNAEFETVKNELNQRGDALEKELRDKNQEIADALNAEAERIKKELGEKAEGVITSLETSRDRAAELVDLVSTSATAGAFGKEADKQKDEADRWRTIGIKLAILAGVIAVLSIGLSIAFGSSTSLVVAKVAAVALFLSIAGYAANQSGHHRRREQRARRLELELIAFPSFTEPLDDPDQKQVRKEFIERLFVGDPGEDGSQKALTEDNISMVTRLLDAFRKSSGSGH